METLSGRDVARADQLRKALLGSMRYEILDLALIQEVGTELFGDQNGIGLYGLSPEEWFARGVRVFGRTCIEATVDRSADLIGSAVSACLADRRGEAVVVDLFAGSGNLMLNVAFHLSASYVGVEVDRRIVELSWNNLSAMGLPVSSVRNDDWEKYLSTLTPAQDTVFIVAPPWGDAFSFEGGLDLRMTSPPVIAVLDGIQALPGNGRLFAVVQIPVHGRTRQGPVHDLARRYPLVGSGVGCLVFQVRGR